MGLGGNKQPGYGAQQQQQQQGRFQAAPPQQAGRRPQQQQQQEVAPVPCGPPAWVQQLVEVAGGEVLGGNLPVVDGEELLQVGVVSMNVCGRA
jgi:hypothetical protein